MSNLRQIYSIQIRIELTESALANDNNYLK